MHNIETAHRNSIWYLLTKIADYLYAINFILLFYLKFFWTEHKICCEKNIFIYIFISGELIGTQNAIGILHNVQQWYIYTINIIIICFYFMLTLRKQGNYDML